MVQCNEFICKQIIFDILKIKNNGKDRKCMDKTLFILIIGDT